MRVPTFCLVATLAGAASASIATVLPLPATPGDASRVVRPAPGSSADGARSHFINTGPLVLDARLGHSAVARDSSTGEGQTFVLATVTGEDATPASPVAPVPVHLAIVVDRSGSMAGAKRNNAVVAALGVVERMRDGDRVTLVGFDTTASVLAPPTRLDPSSRATVTAAIRSLRAGGETCISCALDTAIQVLDGSPGPRDEVRRILLISDGEATAGVRDIGGLRVRATQAREHGYTVSTIGVDVAFDEQVMAAIAQESNGRHWFVPDASALPAVFAEELGTLESAVAAEAVLTIEPAAGCTLEDVLDRPFRWEAGRVVVPLGTFDAKQEKTVLARVRVPADADGVETVVKLSLTYRNALAREDASTDGALALEVRSDGSAPRELDPFVAARLQRSRTAQTLTTANDLFRRGRIDEARQELARRQSELASAEAPALAAAKALPAKNRGVARPLASDFRQQASALSEAESGFAAAPSAGGFPTSTPAAKSALRRNQANATDLAF
jgi:Ca-activated chloride channel family protein